MTGRRREEEGTDGQWLAVIAFPFLGPCIKGACIGAVQHELTVTVGGDVRPKVKSLCILVGAATRFHEIHSL